MMRSDVTLIHGDSLEHLRALPPDTLDLIFADPPFNVGKKYGGKTDTDLRPDYYTAQENPSTP